MGIEPMTSSLPRKCSAPELHWLENYNIKKAGNETRTRDPQLGRLMLYQLSYSRNLCVWGGQDSNLRRHLPTDLQSAPFDRFGTSPKNEPMDGLEPPTG